MWAGEKQWRQLSSCWCQQKKEGRQEEGEGGREESRSRREEALITAPSTREQLELLRLCPQRCCRDEDVTKSRQFFRGGHPC